MSPRSTLCAPQVPIFQGIDSRCIAVLVQAMRAKVYLPGETVVLAGKTVDALFFVVHGVVEVVVASKLVAQLCAMPHRRHRQIVGARTSLMHFIEMPHGEPAD